MVKQEEEMKKISIVSLLLVLLSGAGCSVRVDVALQDAHPSGDESGSLAVDVNANADAGRADISDGLEVPAAEESMPCVAAAVTPGNCNSGEEPPPQEAVKKGRIRYSNRLCFDEGVCIRGTSR